MGFVGSVELGHNQFPGKSQHHCTKAAAESNAESRFGPGTNSVSGKPALAAAFRRVRWD
jgi:hypothetical protein